MQADDSSILTGGRHRVVIVGAGFGGLFAAKALRRADVGVTVIDRTNHHLFQPLRYQLATGILAEGDVAPPTRDILRRQRNASVMLGEVEAIDLDARRLTVNTLGQHREVPYDSVILAAGAHQSYFGHPEFARHAPGMKTIDDALELRGRIFGAFEMAEREPDPQLRAMWLTFVVGDLMSLDGLPGVAQVAIQSAVTPPRRSSADSMATPVNGPSALATRGPWRRSPGFTRSRASGACACRASWPGCSGSPSTWSH